MAARRSWLQVSRCCSAASALLLVTAGPLLWPAGVTRSTVQVAQGRRMAVPVLATAHCCRNHAGGIGGVHRGGEASLDISADLTELGRTPVAVICAGAKSVLDIPRTLEYLETQVGLDVGGWL